MATSLLPHPMQLNRLYHTRGGRNEYNAKGVDVFAEDWDNLIILDACRLDSFREYNEFDGKLESRISRGSTTDEFMDGNVRDRELLDTVYVSATPALENDKGDAEFCAEYHPWRDYWDENLKTVHPDVTTEFGCRAAEEHPNKRIVIHFLQPHYPFIGETGRREFDFSAYETPETDGKRFWSTVGIDGVNQASESTIRRAYDETLEIVLDSLEELVNCLSGKTVISADHGEMLNDWAWPVPWRVYGHPRGIYTQELVKVPWFVLPHESRRDIREGNQIETDVTESDEELVEERLRDLGYR